MAAAVHLLCGPAGSGKTRRMVERYRACLADRPGSALWLAPTLRAVEALRERLLAESPALCCPRLHTFQDMLEEIIRVNDPEARLLTAVQRRLLAEDAAAELSGGGRLAHFVGVADTRGFADGVLALLTDLERNAVTPDEFSRKAVHGEKERQCAQLYSRYYDELRRWRLHDADGTAGRACELLRQGGRRPFGDVRAVFAGGFSDFTRPQQEFLQLLCGFVEELWVALPSEADGRRAELFARPGATMERLRLLGAEMEWLASGGRQPPDAASVPRSKAVIRGLTPPARPCPVRPAGLMHLERQLFRPIRSVEKSEDATGVSLIEAPGVLGEARLVVRRIKRLLLDGAAADDVLVVLRDVSPYADVLMEVFAEYGVPVEVEGVEPLTRNPAAALLLRAVRLPDDDWPFAGVTALLRNAYFRPLWPEAVEKPEMPQRAETLLRLLAEPRGREAYLRAVRRWAEQQQPGLEDEEAEESRRRRIHVLAKECSGFLHRFFQAWDDAPAAAPLADHVAWLSRFAVDIGLTRAAAEESQDQAALDQLWHELSQWLQREERRHGRGGPGIDRKTFLRRLAALAAEPCLPRTPSGPGRVRVLSANQARHLDADYVFVLGLGERGFPRLTPPQSLFDEQERQALQDAGLNLGPGDLLPEEMLLFYEVVARARRELVLCYPAVDERGQSLLPSSFLLAVRDCFGDNVLPLKQQRMLIEGYLREEPLSAAEYRIRAAAARQSGELHDPALPADLRANLQDAAELNLLRFHEKRHNPYDGGFRDPNVIAEAARLFGPERVFSPTALEEYVDCPFKFFLHHGLRLAPLEDPSEEIEVTRRGQAFHRALARLHRKLKESGVHGPADEVTSHVTREMAEAVDEDVRRAPSPAAQELWRLEGRRLIKLAEKYVEHWRDFVEPWDGAPRPHLFEEDFGLLTVRLDDVEVRISGRIDRVDVAELPEGLGFWVIDYKTGRSAHYTGKALSEYRRLQLTLYALAVEEVLLAGRSARPLGLAYWLVGEEGPKIALPHRSPLQWLEDGGRWRAVRDQLRRWVTTLVRHIRRGHFVLQPRDEHCTQTCGYGQICRITQARGVGKEGMLPLPMASEGADSSPARP
ncbi:MAG TPA: PD-(D/E)XK nuclease family protein [Gemmataceae bacterium]|nr:PD-(D/E)XK nuclease family protein [Gemmataceae bacterium]